MAVGRIFGVEFDEDFISETGQNETEKDQKIIKNTTEAPFAFLPTKEPSKNMGPLLVYTNHAANVSKTNPDSPPNLLPEENPFYHKNNKEEGKDPFVGPYNPNYKKPSKNQKPKPGKDAPMFVTPPPNQVKNPQVQGGQDELLQFIHQHPEISNYPSGSVVEIHNVPSKPFVNQGRPQHFIPYVIPQNGHDDLPPGITLEQILQEVHKNANPHGHVLPFPTNQFSNGPILLAPQSPILPNRPNATYQGLSKNRIDFIYMNLKNVSHRSNVPWNISKSSRNAAAGRHHCHYVGGD